MIKKKKALTQELNLFEKGMGEKKGLFNFFKHCLFLFLLTVFAISFLFAIKTSYRPYGHWEFCC